MATIAACTAASLAPRLGLLSRGSAVRPSAILELPTMARKGKVSCSLEEKPTSQENGSNISMGTSLMAAASAATLSSPAMALVDERMTTEGTGLPFGLSNNLLGWILLGVFALIWSLYIVYTFRLEEDEESGLSL